MNENYEKRGYLLEDYRLFHLRDSQGAVMPYHYHSFCKMLLLLSGSGGYYVEGHRYALKPGDIVLLGEHCVHHPAFEVGVPYERIILYLSPSFLKRESTEDCLLDQCFSGKDGPVLRLPEQIWQKLRVMTMELEQELSERRFGSDIASRGLLLRILVTLCRCQQRKEGSWIHPTQLEDGVIAQIMQYLDGNLTQECSMDELAARFYLSKYHMMHRFRQETGTTIHTYLTERRLFLARDLISHGVPSTEACFQAGFGSFSSFSRAYGRLFGTTPTGRPIRRIDLEASYE